MNIFGHFLVISHCHAPRKMNSISMPAKALVKNNVKAVGEGANMPCTYDAVNYLLDKDVLMAPAKAANAGGVAVSALEMAQNNMRTHLTKEEVDAVCNKL